MGDRFQMYLLLHSNCYNINCLILNSELQEEWKE